MLLVRRGHTAFHGWRIVGVLAVTETVSWGVLYYSFAVVQVPMRAELGMSPATVAGAWSLAVLVAGVMAVPVGRWLDRHGARGLMTAGSVLAVLMVVAWSRVQTATELYLVFAGVGLVSAAVLYEPAFAVVVRWFAADRARALLTVTVVAGFASTVFLPLSQALIHAVGWRHALLVLAMVLAVTTVLPHALVLRRDPADLGLQPDGASSPPPSQPSPGPDDRLGRLVGWAASDRRFRLLTVAFTANAMAVVVVAVHLVPHLRELGHPAMVAATAAGSLGALSVTGRLLVTVAARGRSTGHVVAVAFGAQAVGAVVLLLAGRTVPGAVFFVLLFGLGFGVGTIAKPAMLAEAYGTVSYATVAALLGIALTAARVVGPLAAGAVRAWTGSYQAVAAGLIAACAVAAVAVARGSPTGACARPGSTCTDDGEPAATDRSGFRTITGPGDVRNPELWVDRERAVDDQPAAQVGTPAATSAAAATVRWWR
jgi:Major Facilitator Superfamily